MPRFPDESAGILALIVLLGLTIGTYTQNINPECAKDIAYSTVVVLKSIAKK
jgi:hypothetical protein